MGECRVGTCYAGSVGKVKCKTGKTKKGRTKKGAARDVAKNRGGKGSHRNFVHPKVAKPVTLSGKTGDDAKKYQERAVKKAIEDSQT